MSKKLWRAVAPVLVGLLALSCNPQSPRFAMTSSEKRGVLTANGMKFVIMPDPSTELVEVDVHYDVGSREDPEGKAGLAHLVEHLMFQMRPDGQDKRPIFDTLLDLTTFINAFTEWDATHYWSTVRKENVDAMLKIEAMRLYYTADLPGTPDAPAFGCSSVPEPEFEREREVVRNEIRNESSADDYVQKLVEAAMYPKGHAYQRDIGGNDQQIASLSHADVCGFMQKYYAPERATLLIAGNVDVDETVKAIEKWFGKIPKRAGVPRVPVAQFTAKHDTVEIKADVERSSVWVGWALPPANTPEGEAAQYGANAVIARLSARGRQYDFAYSVSAAIIGGKLAPLFAVTIELKGLDRLDEALEFAKNSAHEAYRGWNEGSELELEEQKNRQQAEYIANLEQLSSRTVQMGYLVQFTKDMEFSSNEQYFVHTLNKIKTFNNEKIADAVKKYIDWDKASIVLIKPNKEGIKGDTRAKIGFAAKPDAAIAAAAVDPSEAKKPIKVGAELKSLAGAQRFTLGNGMEVVMLPTKSQLAPLATARLIFKNTGEASTPENPALAAGAAAFLHRIGDMDPNGAENTDVFSRTGVQVFCQPGLDSTICESSGISIYLDVMVRGLERLITAGEYSQPQIEEWAKATRERWKLKSFQERNEYQREIFTALFGPEHPYTKAALITTDAAGKVHRDGLDSFRHKHFSAGNATLVLVGSFDPKEAEALVRKTFGDWGRGNVDKPVAKEPFKRNGPVYVGVKMSKEDQQVFVAVNYPAPAGIDGQEGGREVLANMLNQRAEDMRFKLGSTYGLYIGRQALIGPTAYTMHGSGGLRIGGSVDAERAGETLKALRDSLNGLRNGDADFDQQFARARRQLIQKLLGESTVTDELAARLSFIAEHGLDTNWYNTLLQQIAACSPAQVRALIKSEIDPANEVVVLMGDSAHLEKTFREAGITDVKYVEPEYK
jgi:zinc protease